MAKLRFNIDAIWPIGSIFFNINPINPSQYFGGIWEEWGKGRVPVGIDSSDNDFNVSEKTGGSKYVQDHRHNQILVDEVTVRLFNNGSGKGYSTPFNNNGGSNPMITDSPNVQTGNSGNLQPYITCYMWKRVA